MLSKQVDAEEGAVRGRADGVPDVRVTLSALWVAMMFVFAYVDIFAHLRADVVEGVLAEKVAGAGFTINQAFLIYTTAYVLVPILMIPLSLVAPSRFGRVTNLVVAPVYAVSIVASAVGETWAYYLIGSAVEVVVLLAIVYIAWTWPRRAAVAAAAPSAAQQTRVEP